jgi:Protein of unknown function (DUF2806)
LADDTGTDDAAEGSSKPLIEVTGMKVNLAGIEKFKGVFNNLIKTFQRGIGRWYEPTGRVRDAKADRVVANERAQTFIDLTRKAGELAELQNKLGINADALQNSQGARALTYLFEDVLRKQENREKVIEAVAIELKNSPPKRDADAEIEDDWLTDFWNLAENISRDEVRLFLTRLLAKEVARPGTISPLTLRVLSTLTPHVAKRFEHFCRLSIRDGNDVFVIHPSVFPFQNIGPLDDFGVTYDDLYDLESFGLLRSAETIILNFAPNLNDAAINYAGMDAKLNFSGIQMHQLKFTRAGAELRELLPLSPIPEYTRALSAKLKAAFVVSQPQQ